MNKKTNQSLAKVCAIIGILLLLLLGVLACSYIQLNYANSVYAQETQTTSTAHITDRYVAIGYDETGCPVVSEDSSKNISGMTICMELETYLKCKK